MAKAKKSEGEPKKKRAKPAAPPKETELKDLKDKLLDSSVRGGGKSLFGSRTSQQILN